jgi:hypothetical protein
MTKTQTTSPNCMPEWKSSFWKQSTEVHKVWSDTGLIRKAASEAEPILHDMHPSRILPPQRYYGSSRFRRQRIAQSASRWHHPVIQQRCPLQDRRRRYARETVLHQRARLEDWGGWRHFDGHMRLVWQSVSSRQGPAVRVESQFLWSTPITNYFYTH